MFRNLSILFAATIALAVLAGVGRAGSLTACGGVRIVWACEGSQPVPTLLRSGRDRGLTYLLGRGDLGAARLPVGQQSLALTANQELTVVGYSDDPDACCLSHLSLVPPADLLCPSQSEIPDSVSAGADADTAEHSAPLPLDPDPQPATDFAITLDGPGDCPVSAAGNLCRATLTVSLLEGPRGSDPLPVFLWAEGAALEDFHVVVPANCFSSATQSAFCQIEATLPDTLALPVAIRTGGSRAERELEICARLGGPEEEEERIRMVQQALRALGLDPGPVDGQDGPATLAALGQLSSHYGLPTYGSALDPELLQLLGLAGFSDANTANNQSCVRASLVPLPPLACDAATTRSTGDGCRCLYPSMTRSSDTTCRCTDGRRLVPGRGCIGDDRKAAPTPRPAPLVCDPATTVRRGDACVCRYQGMRQISAARCACPAGSRPGDDGRCR